MPTQKNRFSVSLDDETYRVYKRFAELSEKPLATVVADMLVQGRETFVQLGVMLQQVHHLQGRTEQEQAAFLAGIQMGGHRAQAAADLIGSDLVEMAKMPKTAGADAAPTAPAPDGSAGANNLIHRNKVPKPRPATVPAGSRNRTKGAKRAPT